MNDYIKEWKINAPIKRELEENLNWFRKIFEEEISEEGWGIYVSHIHTDESNEEYSFTEFRIKNVVFGYTNIIPHYITMEEAREFAVQYGMFLDEHDKIILFDKNKITRNRHLLTGLDLGLL